jgi:hypothetical protein
MLRKIFVIAIAMAATQYSFAQEAVAQTDDKKSTTTLNAFVDVYYRYDFSKNPANNRTSFTNSHNSFELGMASFRLTHSIGLKNSHIMKLESLPQSNNCMSVTLQLTGSNYPWAAGLRM